MSRFIVFEGGEGAGKTTQATFLQNRLRTLGHDVVVVREPGGTDLGEQLRNILLNGETPICENAQLLLFLAARAQLIAEIIRPALQAGKVVIADRFSPSTYAYQVNALRDMDRVTCREDWGCSMSLSRKLMRWVADPQTCWPHYVYLRANADVGLDRKAKQGNKLDKFESMSKEKHNEIFKQYEDILGSNRLATKVDATLPPEQVSQLVEESLKTKFPELYHLE